MVAQKLGIKEAHRVVLLAAPPKFDDVLGVLLAIDDTWSGLRLVIRRQNR